MLILSDYIVKHELNPLKGQLGRKDLAIGARKVLSGLGQGLNFRKGYRFFKVRIGSKTKGRMIVFVVAGKKVVPLLVRLKKDKKVGMNMSANNPYVLKQIDKNLENVIRDIEKGNFQEFEV